MAEEEWEGVAETLQRATGADDAPVSAFELAALCGLRLVPSRGTAASLSGDEIRYPLAARPVRQHGLIAHEVGHWALEWTGEEDSEPAARYVAGALMLPRRVFDRDLRETWNVGELQDKHVNASAEMIAIRIVQLRSAVATVFDEGKMRRRYLSAELAGRVPRRPSDYEYELAAEALASGKTARGSGLCHALPVFDGPYRRVVVVCESSAVVDRYMEIGRASCRERV